MLYKAVDHVIFDLDGLLLDSEKGYDRAIDNVVQRYGKKYTHDLMLKCIGTPEPVTCETVVRELNLPISVEEFSKLFYEECNIQLKDPPLLPGAEKLIRHLHKHKIPFGLATSSSNESVAIKLVKYQELFSLFHHKVMGSSDPEVKRGKPNPDIYLVCASRFDLKPQPEKCLVFEDAPKGVTGGISAGMQVVMVPSVDLPDNMKNEATVVLKSLTDFKPELFGLPEYDI